MYLTIAIITGSILLFGVRRASWSLKAVLASLSAIFMLVGWLHDEHERLRVNAPGTEVISLIEHGTVSAIKQLPPELGLGRYTELTAGETDLVVDANIETGWGEMLSTQVRKRGWLEVEFVCIGARCELGGAATARQLNTNN